jgi:hypothetical protein
MKKIIKILIILVILASLYYRYFLYIDYSHDCHIKLKHSLLELSARNIKEALKVLKRTDTEEYNKLCTNIKIINPNFACGGFGGGCYYTGPRTQGEIYVSTARDSNLAWTAAVIAHETCHAIQYNENRELSEDECHKIGDKVLKNLVIY